MRNKMSIKSLSAMAVIGLTSSFIQQNQLIGSELNQISPPNTEESESSVKTHIFNKMIENSKKNPFDPETMVAPIIG